MAALRRNRRTAFCPAICIRKLITETVILMMMSYSACDFVADEQELRQTLFASYNPKVRPASTTNISVSVTLSSLHELDIAKQSMSLNIVLGAVWQDDRLKWNVSQYGGLRTIVTPVEDVWSPPIVIENSVQDVGVLGGEERDNTPIRLNYQGQVSWIPPTEVTFSCRMKIAKYPFDTQECFLVVLGWTYRLSEMAMSEREIDTTTLFTPSGEFDLIATRMDHEDIPAADAGGDNFRKLHFYFTFRRKWEFYGMNLVMPIVLTSILMNAVFALPIESGEKMGFSLTVLLSYVVFLTWVTDNLPPVSSDVSVLQVYLVVVLCLGVLATLLTTWVLHLYHTPPDKPMHPAYVAFATRILVPLRDFSLGKKNAVNADVITKNETSEHKESNSQSLQCEWGETSVLPLSKKEAFEKESGALAEETQHGKRDETRPDLTWQELASLFDRFFLVVFGVSIVTTASVLLGLLYADY